MKEYLPWRGRSKKAVTELLVDLLDRGALVSLDATQGEARLGDLA